MTTTNRRLFHQVFPSKGKNSPNSNSASQNTEDTQRWSHAWTTATKAFTLPSNAIDSLNHDGRDIFPSNDETTQACVEYVLLSRSQGQNRAREDAGHDLLSWYISHMTRHFTTYQSDSILQLLSTNAAQSFPYILQILAGLADIYLYPISIYLQANQQASKAVLDRFQALLQSCLQSTNFRDQLRVFFCFGLLEILEVEHDSEQVYDVNSFAGLDRQAILHLLLGTAQKLRSLGLNGSMFENSLAEIASKILPIAIKQRYAGKWSSLSTAVEQIREWLTLDFVPLFEEILLVVREDGGSVHATEMSHWEKRPLRELGLLRIEELFDIVVDWENGTVGAIEDLRPFLTTAAARSRLISSFSRDLSKRLLHPGASTLQILRMYVCIIRAFAVLEPKGVLLDRIARPIRRYLRDRDDCVKIIVAGLLANPEDEELAETTLTELARELERASETTTAEDEADLNWEDMNWTPDPVDASPEYKKSKTSDVIGMLLSLFESKDLFIKEFQSNLAERLLSADLNLANEKRMLELLKTRLGDSAIQACEVMLRDVEQSQRTQRHILRSATITDKPSNLNVKILSRLYWPALNSEDFVLPPVIRNIQENYAQKYAEYKSMQKLHFLPSLGSIEVTLAFQDRTFRESVQPWQAAVIHAFSTEDSTPITKSVSDLETELEMSNALVLNALAFWVGKLVLKESPPSSSLFSVLETLPLDILVDDMHPETQAGAELAATAASASAIATVSTAAPVKSDEDLLEEKMGLFWQFILGMLTNQGAMPIQRIVMMLNMVVPGGFPFGNDELRTYLGAKVNAGALEMSGANYKVAKPA